MRFRGRQALAVSMASPVAVGSESGLSPAAGRPIRMGGHTVQPGAALTIGLPLPGRTDATDAIPVWVAASRRAGPRVTVVAAVRGFEALAARAASELCDGLDPTVMTGSVAVAPVLRPGGRFAARGQAVSDAVAWQFPGDPGGNRRSREAFAVFSELIVGSSLLVVVTEAEAGRLAIPIVRADLDDARLKRLALAAGAPAVVHARPQAGQLAAAAREMGIATVELVVGTGGSGAAVWPPPGGDRASSGAVAMLAALVAHAGVVRPQAASRLRAAPSVAITETVLVRAPSGGLVEPLTAPGRIVERGGVLGRIAAPLSRHPVEIRTRHDVLVLETTSRAGVRTRGPLFWLGRVPRAVVARARKADVATATERRRRSGVEGPGVTMAAVAALPSDAPEASSVSVATGAIDGAGLDVALRIGWVESVSLPALGVMRLRAKIDTGARTSALHVASMKIVGTTDGPHRRPILELTLPGGSRGGARPAPVRVQVRDHVMVKDTSGHTERRPVIETTLRLGSVQRRIRVTLTNRGDMLFPMLIGRTALGPDVLVDPARRSLLRGKSRAAPK